MASLSALPHLCPCARSRPRPRVLLSPSASLPLDNAGVELLPEDDMKSSLELENAASAQLKLDNFWESFGFPSAKELLKNANGSPPKQRKFKKTEKETNAEESSPDVSQSSKSTAAKRNKWKPEEIRKLITLRGELNSRFQQVKGCMVLWEEISEYLVRNGITRTPAQCKSLWASLVLKYEEIRNEDSRGSWPYYEALDEILSEREGVAK